MSCDELPHPRKFVHRPTGYQHIIGSLYLKITYRPDDPNDPLFETIKELMMFTDSDRATFSIIGAVMGAMWSCLQGGYCAQEQVIQIGWAFISGGRVSRSVRRMLRAGIHPQHLSGFPRRRLFSEKQRHIPRHLRECWSNKMIELRPISTLLEVAVADSELRPFRSLPFPCSVMYS